MYIDSVYQTVQAKLNKEQLGYLRPLYYNLFLNDAINIVFNRAFSELKSNVRKSNWMLDGKDFAHFSEYKRQFLEYYAYQANLSPSPAGTYPFPDDLEFIGDVFSDTKRVEKIHYSDFLELQTNIYAGPSNCNPMCSKVGDKLKVIPTTLSVLNLHYIRNPKQAKWTYVESNGKPLFNPDENDFQDIDMPTSAKNDLISLVFESASIYLREFNATQVAQQNQSQEVQIENVE